MRSDFHPLSLNCSSSLISLCFIDEYKRSLSYDIRIHRNKVLIWSSNQAFIECPLQVRLCSWEQLRKWVFDIDVRNRNTNIPVKTSDLLKQSRSCIKPFQGEKWSFQKIIILTTHSWDRKVELEAHILLFQELKS